jgi:hypothetical protein
MSENEFYHQRQDIHNRSNKPYWKGIHRTWGFWIFLFLMFVATIYYIVSINFSLAPQTQLKHPVENTKAR